MTRMRWLVAVLIIVALAVPPLVIRDLVITRRQRVDRGEQLAFLCGEINDLREGFLEAFTQSGVDLTAPDVAPAIRQLRRDANCTPAEFK
jgi:hypothetical protein